MALVACSSETAVLGMLSWSLSASARPAKVVREIAIQAAMMTFFMMKPPC
jgi:hypothetical protein